MPKLLQPYLDFRGGLNVDTAEDNLADNELMVAENIDLEERGGFSKRKGTQLLNAQPYFDTVYQLFEWKRTGAEPELLAVVGNTLGKLVPPDYRFSGIASLASNWVRGVALGDKGYFLDGQNFYFYTGDNWGPVAPDPDPDCDIEPIRKCRFLLWHPKSARFFAAGNPDDDQALYYSEKGNPAFWRRSSKLYPISGHGPVQALALFGDAVMVFYEDSLWVWRGIDPEEDTTWERIPVALGKVVERSIALTPDSLVVLGEGGLYALLPPALGYTTVLQPGQSVVVNLAEHRVKSILKSIGDRSKVVGVYDPANERYLLAFNDNPTLGRNNLILVLDWGLKAFTLYTGLEVNDFCYRPNGELLAAIGRNVVRMGVGYSDYNGQPIEARVATKYFNLGYPFYKKRMTRLYAAFKKELTEAFQLSMTIVVDHKVEYQVDNQVLYEGFVWGDPWGRPWGAKDFITTRSKISASGHRVQVRFSNAQPDMPMTVYGFAVEFRPIRAKGRRVDAGVRP